MVHARAVGTLALASFSVLATWAGGAQDAGQSAAPERVENAHHDPVANRLPAVRLSAMPGFDDNAAYARSVAHRAAELTARAATAKKPTVRVDLRLAAANLILAYEIEPACSARLLGLTAGIDEADVAQALDRADRLVGEVDVELTAMADRDDLPAGWRARSVRRLRTLRGFASGLRGYLSSAEDTDQPTSLRRAASALSPMLEDENPAVAAAAALWQACLRRQEKDPERALAVLDPATADPPDGAVAFAFFSRLLRCRLVADRGGFAAAVAFLMQIEERSDEWLSTDAERQDAMRAARLVQVQILRRWHDRLDTTTRATERQWCLDRIESIMADSFGGDRPSVFRLSSAVPIVAGPPAEKDAALPLRAE